MASTRINELNTLSSLDDADLILSFDDSASETKAITRANLKSDLRAAGGDGIDLTGDTLSVDLAQAVVANEQLVLSGMTDSNHNGTYNAVYVGGSKLQARARQSGSNVEMDIEREAAYSVTVSGTGLVAADVCRMD